MTSEKSGASTDRVDPGGDGEGDLQQQQHAQPHPSLQPTMAHPGALAPGPAALPPSRSWLAIIGRKAREQAAQLAITPDQAVAYATLRGQSPGGVMAIGGTANGSAPPAIYTQAVVDVIIDSMMLQVAASLASAHQVAAPAHAVLPAEGSPIVQPATALLHAAAGGLQAAIAAPADASAGACGAAQPAGPEGLACPSACSVGHSGLSHKPQTQMSSGTLGIQGQQLLKSPCTAAVNSGVAPGTLAPMPSTVSSGVAGSHEAAPCAKHAVGQVSSAPSEPGVRVPEPLGPHDCGAQQPGATVAAAAQHITPGSEPAPDSPLEALTANPSSPRQKRVRSAGSTPPQLLSPRLHEGTSHAAAPRTGASGSSPPDGASLAAPSAGLSASARTQRPLSGIADAIIDCQPLPAPQLTGSDKTVGAAAQPQHTSEQVAVLSEALLVSRQVTWTSASTR
jgi:hypothetical protein